MPVVALDAEEREEIRVGLAAKQTYVAIAAGLGRHRGTIGEEVKRNGGRKRYCAVDAQKRADKQRARPKTPKLVANKSLATYVTKRLKAKDSPMTIAIELARGVWGRTESISHECIYQAIYKPDRGLEPGLHTGLHLKRRRRKHRNQPKTPSSHSLGEFNSISTRPKIAEERTEVGHLEGDLIVGAFNRSALITVFDRTSRKLWLERVASKTAEATLTSLLRLFNRIPLHLRRTMTWDQGAEIARWIELSQRRNIDIYIADPKAPWQRPTNENGNALVRRYVGKGTDLKTYTTKDLRAIEHRINTIPRRVLGWATANDIYNAHVAMTN